MLEKSPNALLFSEEPWPSLASLCRRICLLRALGRHGDADALHAEEFAPAMDALRNAPGPLAAFDEERVRLLQAMEQERVANALVLAELLRSLNLAAPAAPVEAKPAPAPPVPRVRSSIPADIADFLDDMLARGHDDS